MNVKIENKSEIWKDIPGFEGRYLVSDLGRVKSVRVWKRSTSERILKAAISAIGYSSGYYTVVLCKGGVCKTHYVHRLVAVVFVPNPDSLPQVNHGDGNTLNNKASNLEWSSAADNINHAWDSGLVKRDAERVSDAVILSVRRLKQKGLTHRAIADQVGIPAYTVSRIIRNARIRYQNI